VVEDDKEEKRYDYVLFLGEDKEKKELVYGAFEGKEWFLVRNGLEQEKYMYISDFFGERFVPPAVNGEDVVVSPNLDKLAYVNDSRYSGGKTMVIENGKVGEGFRQISPLFYSPDGRLIYFATNNERQGSGIKWYVVIDSKKELVGSFSLAEPGRVFFSKDGKHLAYFVNDRHDVLRKDGEEIKFLGKPWFDEALLLEDGSVVYAYGTQGMVSMVINGEVDEEYVTLSRPIEIDNGVLYFAVDGEGNFYRVARKL